MTFQPNRRSVIVSGCALVAAGLGLGPADARTVPLKTLAARKGLSFGTAVFASDLTDADFRPILLSEVDTLVATFEMKWGQIEKERGTKTFQKGDQIVAFAAENGLSMRGHTAVWHQNLPPWLEPAIAAGAPLSLVTDHVREVVARHDDAIGQWDVVNEAIETKDGRPDNLRDDLFMKGYGPSYITAAFRAAREAAPNVKLFYNDYNFEYDTPGEDLRRSTALTLLEVLRRENLVDGLGIQSHLTVGNRFNPKKFQQFLGDAADLGLEIVGTEFDLDDRRLPLDFAPRDRAIAEHARIYLDALLSEPAVTGLLTWGLSTKVLPAKRADKAPGRGLPYDETFQPTPLRAAIAKAFETAPDRRKVETR